MEVIAISDGTLLLIIDCVRADHITGEITPNMLKHLDKTNKTIKAVNNNTEPAIGAMLTGVHPLDSGLVGLGQKDTHEILAKHWPEELKKWWMFSPATVFSPFTNFVQGKHIDDVPSWLLEEQNVIIHLHDVHNYRDDGRWREFYQGYEPIPEEKTLYNMKKVFGFGRPWEGSLGDVSDAGYLKAKYKGSLNLVDEWLEGIRDYFDTIIVTADHGEAMGESGVVFRHQVLHDALVNIPLLSNVKIEASDQTEILFGNKGKAYTVSAENTWQSGVRVDMPDGYIIEYWNRIFDVNKYEGNPGKNPSHLLMRLNEEVCKFPDRKPALIEGQEISIR